MPCPCWEWLSLSFRQWPCTPAGVPGQGPCLLHPQWGSACAPCHPHSAVPPRITLPPSLPGPVLLHSPVRLTCNATGAPSPMLMWLKDGNPVSTAGTAGLQVSGGGWGVPAHLSGASVDAGNGGQGLGPPGGEGDNDGPGRLAAGRKGSS